MFASHPSELHDQPRDRKWVNFNCFTSHLISFTRIDSITDLSPQCQSSWSGRCHPLAHYTLFKRKILFCMHHVGQTEGLCRLTRIVTWKAAHRYLKKLFLRIVVWLTLINQFHRALIIAINDIQNRLLVEPCWKVCLQFVDLVLLFCSTIKFKKDSPC